MKVIYSAIALSFCFSSIDCFPQELESLLSGQLAFIDYFSFQQMMQDHYGVDIVKPANSLSGLLRPQTEDVTLIGYGPLSCIGQTADGSGGVLNCKNFSLIREQSNAIFVANTSLAAATDGSVVPRIGGGAVCSSQLVTVSDNRTPIFFANNSASAAFGGAICSNGNCEFSKNKGVLYFGYNMAKEHGGGICTQGSSIFLDNENTIFFVYNYSLGGESLGGAIYAQQDALFQGNLADMYFVGNISRYGGGIHVRKNCQFRGNVGTILFLNNASEVAASGGGVYVFEKFEAIDNQGSIYFNGNYAFQDGGAIWAKGVTIQNNGPVSFLSNMAAAKGGAIFLGGPLKLSADYGDIVFLGNSCTSGKVVNKAVVSTDFHLNSIAGSGNLSIGAREGRKVIFYDPIDFRDATSPVSFNPEKEHKGIILFSSSRVPHLWEERTNFISYFQGTVTIANGCVAIEDGADLTIMNLTSNGGGIIRLGQNGSLSTFSYASKFAITNLALNLPSLLKDDSKPPRLSTPPKDAPTNSIVVSGQLQMLNDDNTSPYESSDLSVARTRVAILELVDKNGTQVNIDALNLESINEGDHYGYLGKWTPYWEEYTGTEATPLKHRVLYANWTPIGYVPNPKFQANIVTNALWESFYIADSSLHEYSVFSKRFSVYGGAQGLVHYQYDRSGVPAFHMKTSGYSLGTGGAVDRSHRFSLNFGQYFSQMKEQGKSNTLSSMNYSVAFKWHSHWFSDLFSTTISGVYSYGKHVVDHKYKDEDRKSTGDFYSNTYGMKLHMGLPALRLTRQVAIMPFAEVLGVRSTLSSFTEEGDYARAFSVEHPLYEVESPVGVRGKFRTYKKPSSEWEVELAYRPTLYRQRPLVVTRLLVSNGTWSTKGSPIARQAMSYRLSHKASLSRHIFLIMNHQGILSSTTFSNYLQAGMGACF